MNFEIDKNLSVTQRKALVKGLTKVAELYFIGEHQPCSVDPNKVNIGCGILHDLKVKNAYDLMNKLMMETNEYSYGHYQVMLSMIVVNLMQKINKQDTHG